jgi:hypothetical protein
MGDYMLTKNGYRVEVLHIFEVGNEKLAYVRYTDAPKAVDPVEEYDAMYFEGTGGGYRESRFSVEIEQVIEGHCEVLPFNFLVNGIKETALAKEYTEVAEKLSAAKKEYKELTDRISKQKDIAERLSNIDKLIEEKNDLLVRKKIELEELCDKLVQKEEIHASIETAKKLLDTLNKEVLSKGGVPEGGSAEDLGRFGRLEL